MKYLIVGGVAVNFYGLSGGTKDVDLLIPRDVENAEKILEALGNLPWGLAKEVSAEEILVKPFTIIGDMPRVDLLLAAGTITFSTAFPRRIIRTIDGIRVPVVALDDLIRSKQTGRPSDKLIIAELRQLNPPGRARRQSRKKR